MNAERRIERVRKVVEPPGTARTDAWITCELASRIDAGPHFAFADARGIWDEIRSVWSAVGGISYERLEQGGLQWPCPDEQHPGTPRLHETSFAHGPRATLACIPYVPTSECTDAQYPWLLNTGRNLYQFNAGTMTARTLNSTLRPHDTLDIAPADAERMDIQDGTLVRVCSRYGATVLLARKDDRVKPGELFATFHEAGLAVNRLTGSIRDRLVATPEYKVTAVRIELVTDTSTAARTKDSKSALFEMTGVRVCFVTSAAT